MSTRVTREQAHAMIEAWWAPECVYQKNVRHRAIDALFDEEEQQQRRLFQERFEEQTLAGYWNIE